jgi:periplasmic divalent cation tolerance protein
MMSPKPKHAIVLVTAPDLKTARTLANAALRSKLVACANIFTGIESHYWWQGRIEKGAETMLAFKTTRRRLAALEKLVQAKHPYDTPEFVVLNIDQGSKHYLDWLSASVGSN